jgi:hypothetical protein
VTRRKVVVVAVAASVLATLLVVVGRWEESRSARHEVDQMRLVLNAVGDIARRRPTGYRVGPPDCLTYATLGNLYGLQVCFDRAGRVVETVDRRPAQPKYASLVYDPALSTLCVSPVLIRKLFALPRIPAG